MPLDASATSTPSKPSALSASANAPDATRRGLSSFALKLAAIAGMTCNHACYIFYDHLPDHVLPLLFCLGGITFPIMAFLLVEGYRHTSNVRRYAMRLLVFACVSQIPYGLFLAPNGNVLFTLLLGLALLHGYDHLKNRVAFWTLGAVGTALSALCDWGVLGPIMILMMHALPDAKQRVGYPLLVSSLSLGLPSLSQAAESQLALANVLYAATGAVVALPLLLAYDGRRGRPLKWFFYAYYPAHIAVLGLIKGLLLGDWS